MKKITAIFFLVVYIFSTTEAHQLFKLPVIFEHYAEHQQENSQITLLEFLDMHYLHGSPKDKDYGRDMQLPFKTTNDCVSSVLPAFVPTTLQFTLLPPMEVTTQKVFITKDPFILCSYLANIWQPPKTC